MGSGEWRQSNDDNNKGEICEEQRGKSNTDLPGHEEMTVECEDLSDKAPISKGYYVWPMDTNNDDGISDNSHACLGFERTKGEQIILSSMI